ncbi:hypothetical protein EB061_01035 [bacterium]|jgi:hypothetical protein|nr:hypothetical protein [bacterium]
MKILLVDANDDVLQKWVNPLRNQGWGVVLARSAEDAARMMILHGEGVEAFVVNESFVAFAESRAKPFVVLTEKWNDRQIMAHQNSGQPAAGYLPRSGAVEPVLGLLAGRSLDVRVTSELKATGTGGGTSTRIRLQDASRLLSSPSITGTKSGSVKLSAPKIKLRTKNESAEPSLRVVPEPVAIDAPPPVEVVSPAEPALDDPPVERSSGLAVDPGVNTAAELVDDLSGGLLAGTPAGEESPIDLQLVPPPTDAPVSIQDEELPLMDLLPDEPALDAHREWKDPPPVSRVQMTPDLEAMKTYLAMREQDVAVLTGQVRSSQERITQLEMMLKTEKARNVELEETLAKADQTIKNYDLEKRVEMEVLQKQVEDLEQNLREKTEKARLIETRLRLMSEEVNKVKERVRVDIRRIRVREKELEGQVEILKKDSGALLQARDEKILELKRRNDLLEFNMELVQEQYEKERRLTEELKGKLKEAAQVMKQANGFLEQ